MTKVRIIQALLVAAAAAAATPGRAETVRMALVVGSNRGGSDSAPLRYAETDADRFARVLGELGGVKKDRLVILRAPGNDALRAAFEKMSDAVRDARARTPQPVVFVFYYSGHADGVNLELGRQLFPFAELRERIDRTGADVRVAFVDSCKSGALTQERGMTRGPSFDLLVTDKLDVGGAAIITSSSASENAQESAEIGSGYFTHFVVSALRGAADADADGRVTLAETYRYASLKTIAETARTMAGAQHPSYAFKITGRGDLVLSDLRGRGGALRFPAGDGGEYLVVDASRGEVAAEVVLPPGERRRLALAPGEYVVGRRAGDKFLADRVRISSGEEVEVVEANLRPERLAIGRPKGPRERPDLIGAGYGIVGGALGTLSASSEAALAYRRRLGNWLLGPRVALGFADVEDRGLRYSYRAYVGEMVLQRRFSFDAFDLLGGLGLGGVHARQRILSGEEQAGVLLRTSASAGVEVPLVDALMLSLGWDAGAGILRLNGSLSQRLFLRATLGVSYGF